MLAINMVKMKAITGEEKAICMIITKVVTEANWQRKSFISSKT